MDVQVAGIIELDHKIHDTEFTLMDKYNFLHIKWKTPTNSGQTNAF
jgi:hypothetical protein